MDKNKIRFRKQYDENDFIEFDTINGIKHRKNIWIMIQQRVLENMEFHDALYNIDKRTPFSIKNGPY
jgi:hypothetical protein